jgi:hypothetical protein
MINSMGTALGHAAKHIRIVAGILALALTLTACDKCGNFLGQPRAEQQACRDTGPALR